MRNLKNLLLFLIFIYPAIAFAAPIAGVSTFLVGQDDMDGMLVDIDFADSSGISDVTGIMWGSTSHGVSGEGWSLTYTGSDTQGWDDVNKQWVFDWVLTTTHAIDNFTIQALPGNTVFDIVFYPERTPDSSGGIWLPNGETGAATSGTVVNPYFTTFDWEFSDAVFVQGTSPYGDLYSTLKIDFATDFIGRFQFVVDTDNISPVPVPSTLALLSFGLLGLCAAGRKKIMK